MELKGVLILIEKKTKGLFSGAFQTKRKEHEDKHYFETSTKYDL